VENLLSFSGSRGILDTMQWTDFAGKKIGLLGAGKENVSLIPWLQKAEATVELLDASLDQQKAEELKTKYDIDVINGSNYLEDLGQYNVLFRSPGLPVSTINKAVEQLDRRPVVTSAVNLLLQLKPCLIIGVTGTKGKGTTASYLHAILQAAGRQSFLVGNIGQSVFDVWDQITKDSIIVAELSSFQLEDVTASPDIAIVLPVSEDHLEPLSERNPNFHQSVEAYRAAKANITKFQTVDEVVIFAQDSQGAREIASQSKAKAIGLSQANHQAVGLINDDSLMLEGNQIADLAGITGRHRQLDAGMAAIAAHELELSPEQITEGLKRFRALPHRMEPIEINNKVVAVDDSYATNPEATIAALTAFTKPVILIAGGSTKGAEFSQLAEAIKKSSVQAVILLGQEGPHIAEALHRADFSGQIKEGAKSMGEAVSLAISLMTPNSIVVLSPACASFDMFGGADDRGNQFQTAIKEQLHGDS
jgi:UDP-N-acetylmuramoylalanine--D-glutamate ligase